MSDTRDGATRISEERARQRSVEDYTNRHDDEHYEGELARAAACYAAPCKIYEKSLRNGSIIFSDPWPWSGDDDKRPYDEYPTVEERVRVLEKAGALIAAEIDRLLRIVEQATK